MSEIENENTGLSQEFIDKLSAEKPVFKKLFELLKYDNLTEEEKIEYEASRQRKLENNVVARFIKEVEKVKFEVKLGIAKKMKAKDMSNEDISELTGLPIEEIQAL